MCCWRRVSACTALLRRRRFGLGSCDWLWSESPRGRSRERSPGSARLFSVLSGLCCVAFIHSTQTTHYRGSFSSQVDVSFIRPWGELVRRSCCCCCSAWAMQANRWKAWPSTKWNQLLLLLHTRKKTCLLKQRLAQRWVCNQTGETDQTL